MYERLRSRIHKDIDTSDTRDRLNPQRHVLVCACPPDPGKVMNLRVFPVQQVPRGCE